MLFNIFKKILFFILLLLDLVIYSVMPLFYANKRQDFSSFISIKRKIFFSSCLFKNLVFKLFKSSIIQRKTKLGTSITSNFSVVFVCVRGGGLNIMKYQKQKQRENITDIIIALQFLLLNLSLLHLLQITFC